MSSSSSASSGGPGGIEAAIAKHQGAWGKIAVTDLPTDEPGQYTYTSQDPQTTNQKGSAAAEAMQKLALKNAVDMTQHPEYWVVLGRLVMSSKVGRCFSCAAAAAYTLVNDSAFDGMDIAVVGNLDFDHHFVLVGTPQQIATGNAMAVDIWHANLNRQPAATPQPKFRYARGRLTEFCRLAAKDRAKHRAASAKP